MEALGTDDAFAAITKFAVLGHFGQVPPAAPALVVCFRHCHKPCPNLWFAK